MLVAVEIWFPVNPKQHKCCLESGWLISFCTPNNQLKCWLCHMCLLFTASRWNPSALHSLSMRPAVLPYCLSQMHLAVFFPLHKRSQILLHLICWKMAESLHSLPTQRKHRPCCWKTWKTITTLWFCIVCVALLNNLSLLLVQLKIMRSSFSPLHQCIEAFLTGV